MRTIDSGFYYGDTFAPAPLDPARSEHDVHEALGLARAIEWRAGEAFAMFELALSYGIRGFYRRAFELALSGLRVVEEIEHRQWIAACLCSLGALHVDVLAAERAQPLLERALALAHELGSSVWASYAAARLAMAHTLERDFSKAAAVLEGELSEDTPFETLMQRQLWCAQAELLLARGAASEALAVSEKLAATLAPGKVAPRVWILRGQALTALRSAEEVERVFTEAIEASRTFGLRSLLWRAHAGHARFLRTRGRRDEAAGQIQAARTLVQELAVEITDDAEREAYVERAFKHIPERGWASERRLTKQAFGGLTAREREVAALIGGGLSNRAIADKLVVSERTVESYVSSILAKLDFTARTQIAAWAATRRVAPHSG
jgi:DNA-binding CsgD family transcriptional regulator/predicted negative regulator of RcsB-dependent stress response